jgi:hypothetical protein
MTSMSRSTVWLAAFTLVVAAVLGSYLGYSRASAAPGGGGQSAGNATPTLAAKTASPIPGAVNAAPDEAFIRKIAQEELQSALHPKHTAVAKDDSDDNDDSDDHGPAAPPSVAAVTPVPAPPNPTTPPAPPPPTGLY